MNLVYLYGPPAAGKLTVGSELASLTGYKVFHNHVSLTAVASVFDFGSESFWRMVYEMREWMLESAARQGIDVIATGVYHHPVDREAFERRFACVERHGGRVCLVRLTCTQDLLEQRISNESRRRYNKMLTADQLRADLASKDLLSPIPGRESLTLGTGVLSPSEAARRIIEHYGLLG